MRILIVEDNPLNRKLLRTVLTAEGIDVVEAVNGRDALRVLHEGPVDAIVSDVLMPDMDGFRLCEEVRSRPQTRDIPFVMVTGTYTQAEDAKLGSAVGADEYLPKPVSATLLLRALDAATQKRGARPSLEDVEALEVARLHVARIEEKLAKKVEDVDRAGEVIRGQAAEIDGLRGRIRELEEEGRHAESVTDQSVASVRAMVTRALSHDLRQGLNTITGFADLLASGKTGPLTPIQVEYLKDMAQAARDIGRLLDAASAGALPPGPPQRPDRRPPPGPAEG